MSWDVKPEKEQSLLGLVKFVLSRCLFLVNGPMARAETYKKFGAQCERGVKGEGARVQRQDSQLE